MTTGLLNEIKQQELEELLVRINRLYGYDFTEYAVPSIKRRITRVMNAYKMSSLRELETKIVDDEVFFQHFVEEVTVTVTEMFRDPEFYQAIRQQVLPKLATYPHFNIWHAGCSTAEEVYSMAILLKEEGLLQRCYQYATDINAMAIKTGKRGIYPLKDLEKYTINYQKAGGKADLSNYFTIKNGMALFDRSLGKNMVFAQHNLVADHSFNEFHLIICRNVLIYFDRELQERVLKLFNDSLPVNGFLALGKKETLRYSIMASNFQIINKNEKIWRKFQ